jgi:RNA polymerase sigma factor (sigma-70 family)
MATSQMSEVIQHLRRAVLLQDGAGLTDGQLLEGYLSRRDQAALAALVRRHGPMVWGVCRRVLRNHEDAEDAFQATFLVLVRKAGSIVPRQMVANWLYGVAHQTALNARATATRRKVRERQVTEMPEPAVAEPDLWADLQPLLDAELSRLPDKYRAVVILCDLEGKTRKEAARQLGVPEGTVAGRLARARGMLAQRLAQRGVALPGGALAAVLAQKVASAGVPLSVVESTITAASLVAAGKAASGAISVKVAALAAGAMKAMLFSKLRTALAVVLILGLVATGATILTCRTWAGQDDKKPAAEKLVEPTAKVEKEKEALTAWGKEVGGLQAGLSISNRNDIQIGGKATTVVKLRNLSNKSITASVWPLWLPGPQVLDTQGKQVRATCAPHPLFEIIPTRITLQPGQTVEMAKSTIFVVGAGDEDQPVPEGVVDRYTIYVRPGTYQAGFTGFLQEHPTLATGTVEFKVKDAEDGLTAWGKDLGGLQAGLGYLPGQKRAFSHGETVSLVVRVRNVGKEEVKFKYLRQFFIENPPTVTAGQGKRVPLTRVTAFGLHVPQEVTLAPGKEIELYELKLGLMPANDPGNKWSETVYATGKFLIQYEQVFGNSSSGTIMLDPILSKLATGKLDLEIKADPPPEKGQADEPPWGDVVEGVQARLSPKKRQWKASEAPAFEFDLRNQGKKTFHGAVATAYCELQVDGKWYKYRGTFPGASLVPLKPGANAHRWLTVSLDSQWMEETAAKTKPDREGEPIRLPPGKHTIRVAYRMFRDVPATQFDTDQEEPDLRVVTDAVEIEIAEPAKKKS